MKYIKILNIDFNINFQYLKEIIEEIGKHYKKNINSKKSAYNSGIQILYNLLKKKDNFISKREIKLLSIIKQNLITKNYKFQTSFNCIIIFQTINEIIHQKGNEKLYKNCLQIINKKPNFLGNDNTTCFHKLYGEVIIILKNKSEDIISKMLKNDHEELLFNDLLKNLNNNKIICQ